MKFGPLNGKKSLRQHFGFNEDMKQALGREVDLISVDFAAIENEYLRAYIDKDRELVYDKAREHDLACAP